jgi:hypothetical protein
MNLSDYLAPEFDLKPLNLAKANSEEPFLNAALELSRETACYLSFLAAVRKGEALTLPRNQAIAAGHLVRLARLMRFIVLAVTRGNDGDQQLALARQIIDSAATVAYLLEDETEHIARFNAYVLDSLIAEREFNIDVQKQIAKRGGERLPIEDRITQSMANTLSAAGVDSLTDVPSRKRNSWPTAETRVKLLGEVAYSLYRVSSGAIHGTFAHIEKNYWQVSEDGIRLDWTPAQWRPQALLSPSIVCLDAMAAYLQTYDKNTLYIVGRGMMRLEERLREVDHLHEEYLQRKL